MPDNKSITDPINIFDSITGALGTAVMVKEKLNDEALSAARLFTCKTKCPYYLSEVNFCGKCLCNCRSKSNSKTSLNKDTLDYEITHCPNGIWPIRLPDGTIGGSDEEIANMILVSNGKEKLKEDRIKYF